MPRLKKITIDAGNGRVIESVDVPRIAKKPVFYAGETTSVDVNAVELVGNGDGTSSYGEIRSAGGNVVNMRLGTTTTLVAQGTDFVFTPPARYQATLSFTTAPAVQVPLTVQVVTVPTAAPTFDVFNFYPATVTVNTFIGSVAAEFRATLQTGLQPAVTVAVPIEEIDAFRYPGLEIFVAGSSVTFGATLNTTATATFTVTTSADTVSAIAIANAGSGYPDGTYNLTVAGGTVTTAATAQAVASGGAIISVSITQNGSGYVTAPAATLFRPAKSLLSVSPSQIVAVVDGRPRFYWHTPSGNATAVTLSFSAPDSTSTPPPATAPLVRIEHLGPDSSGIPLWEVRVVSAGYGYSSTPTVTVPPVPVSARRRTTVATVSGSNLLVNTTYDNSSTAIAEDGSLIPSEDPYHLALSGRYLRRGVGDALAPYTGGAMGADLRTGTYPLVQRRNTTVGTAPVVVVPLARGQLGRGARALGYGTREGMVAMAYDPGEFSASQFYQLAGRSLICAVIPQRDPLAGSGVSLLNEAAPDRYATVRVTFRPHRSGFAEYHVGQSYLLQTPDGVETVVAGILSPEPQGDGSVPAAKFAPGGAFFEPVIEFLDYGKGYKTAEAVGPQALRQFSYNLRVLSGLRPGYVIDDTPGARTVTAVTTGIVGADSFIPTALSERATVVTLDAGASIQTIVDRPGFGYQQAGYFSAASVTIGGVLRSVQLINRPAGYGFGTYDCTVSGGAGSGAQVKFIVGRRADVGGPTGATKLGYTTTFTATVVCGGSGYTSAPQITAPTPGYTGVARTNVTVGGNLTGQSYFYDEKINRGTYQVTDIRINGNFNSSLGYEASPLPLRPVTTGIFNAATQMFGSVYLTPRGFIKEAFLTVVCNGLKYRTRGPVGVERNVERGISYNVSLDPEYPVPAGFTPLSAEFEYDLPGDVVTYPLQFTESPEPGGTAEGFVVFTGGIAQNETFAGETKAKSYRVFLTKTGYGYVTKPAITVQAPPIAGYYINSVQVATTFGTPLADFDGNQFATNALPTQRSGDKSQAVLYAFSGIPHGTEEYFGQLFPAYYACTVTPSPIVGAETVALACGVLRFAFARTSGFPNHDAQVRNNVGFAVAREKIWQEMEGKKVFYAGVGVQRETVIAGQTVRSFNKVKNYAIYATPPTVSAPTFPGAAITAVTVVCQGYYYTKDSAILSDQDPTGSQAVLQVDEVKRGRITRVSLKEGGALYSNTPKIVFTEPGLNPADIPSEGGVKNNMTITVASANTVLGSADAADALLELYEVEGANQQVTAQIPVTLARRVSST